MNGISADNTATIKAPAAGDDVFALLQLAKGLEERVETALGEVALSSAKFGVLGHLVAAGEAIPLSELASRINCVRSNVTQMVDRLEAEGLVRRVPRQDDRRVILAELTEEGARRHAAGVARMQVVAEQVAAATEPEEMALVLKVLRAVG